VISKTRAVVWVTVATMLMSACSASTSSGTKSTSSAPTPGVTKSSITVGGIVSFTSASGFSEAGVDTGVKARFKRANDEGGVNGRKINYIGSQDDGLNPSTALSLARTLVLDSKVFAVVPVGAPAFNGAGAFLVDQKVPFVGWGTTPPFCGNDYGFGVFGCNVALKPTDKVSNASGSMVAKVLGGGTGHTVAIVASDNQASQASLPGTKASFVAAGYRVVYAKAALPLGTVADYSPYAHDLMTADNGKPPEVVFYIVQTPFVIGLNQALAAAGYKGIALDGVNYDPKLLKNPQSKQALQGEYVSLPFEPYESNTPAVKQMVKDLQAVTGSNFSPDQYLAYGYWMADLFLAIVKKAGPNLTRASFLAAGNTNFSHEVVGGVGLIKFPDAHGGPAPCSALVQVQGDKFVTKVPLACYTVAPVGG
jgi:ABC-type branched-subunit amino acid transport system substrate-binding protein